MNQGSRSSLFIFILRLGLFELLFLTPLIFYGWATTFSSVKETFAQIISLFLLCGLCFEVLRRRLTVVNLSSISLFIIFFGLFSLASFTWSVSFYASSLSLGVWGTFFTVYFLTLALVRSQGWMKILVIGVVSSGFLAALYSVLQFYGVELPIWRQIQGRMRIFSTFGNPNYLADYLAATLPLGVLLFFIQKRVWKLLWLVVISILYVSLLLTYTRGAWASLFFSSIFVLVLLYSYRRDFFKKNKLSFALLLLVIFAITLVYSIPGFLNVRESTVIERGLSAVNFKSSASQRFLIWNSALELIKEKPFLGWGVGTFGVHYPEAQGKFLSRKENKDYLPQANRSINVHNDYLHIWTEEGLIGLFLFLGIIACFYRKLFSFLRKNKNEKSSLFLIFFAGGITSFLIHAGVSFPFHIVQNGMVFFFLLALVDGIVPGKIRWKEDVKVGDDIPEVAAPFRVGRLSSLLKRVFLLLVIAGAFYLCFWRVRIFASDLRVKQAQLFMEANLYTAAKKELQEAIRVNPYNAQAFADLTEIYSYFGLYEDVIQAADKAELNWNVPNIHNRKAFAYLKMGQVDKAKDALKRSIYLYPSFAAGYVNLGYINLLEAEESLKEGSLKVAKEKLDYAFLYYTQGNIWLPRLSPPKRLSATYQKYDRLVEEKSGKDKADELECKKMSPPFFFYSKKDYLIFILSPLAKQNEDFNIRMLLYRKNGLPLRGEAYKFSLKLRLENDENLVWGKSFSGLNLTPNTPYILRLKLSGKIPRGKHTLFVTLLVGERVLCFEEASFRN